MPRVAAATVIILAALLPAACASGWPPPSARTDPGVRWGPFLAPETPPYAVQGRYAGELRVRGDSVWVLVDSATITHTTDNGDRTGRIEYIGAALVGPRGFNEGPFIRGSEHRLRETVRAGDALPVAPFFVGVAGDGNAPTEALFVRLIHRLRFPDAPVAESYTWFPVSVGEIIGARATDDPPATAPIR